MNNRTKAIGAVVLLVLVALAVIFWHGRLGGDFWPPDRSFVGPNLVASVIQFIIIFIAVTLLYPPFRRAMERIAHEANEDLHKKMKVEHDKLHAKLNHIIEHHPDIPEFKEPT